MLVIDEIKTYIPIAISCLALIFSFLSFRLSYRQFKRNVAASLPLATATINPVQRQSDWYSVTIKLESRDTHGYHTEHIRVMRPWQAAGISRQQAFEPTSVGINSSPTPPMKNPLPVDLCSRKIKLSMKVAKSGTERPQIHGVMYGTGASTADDIYLYIKQKWWSDTIHLELSLLSMESIERRINLRIVRKIPKSGGIS